MVNSFGFEPKSIINNVKADGAINAFATRFLRHRTVFPREFLADFGFRTLRSAGRVELMRLELRGLVPRWRSVAYRAMNREGRPVEGKAHGLFARILQHEVDHLDGILFLDRVDSLKADVFRRTRY